MQESETNQTAAATTLRVEDQPTPFSDDSPGPSSSTPAVLSNSSTIVKPPTLTNSISDPVWPTPAPRAPQSRVISRGGTVGGLRNVSTGAVPIPPSLQAKMAAMASRGARPPVGTSSGTFSVEAATASMNHLNFAPQRAPRILPGMSNGRRPKPNLTLDGIVSSRSGGGAEGAGLGAGRPSFPTPGRRPTGTPFANFGGIVDPSGALKFGGKAVLHAKGVDFSNGNSFAINMGEFRLDEELGRGNYGAVKKVLHKPTNVMMAMKEIRLELDDAKLNAIIMELDILHRAVAPEIVEFYGAFFIESCVYYAMEYMDAGSLEQLEYGGIPEDVLARITLSIVRGLKFLKDELQVMHRDVKPTNVLVNRKGEVKLCDFGVSGQLEKSLAKTNIGCQSYMAPERIQGESQNNLGTYTVASDVWSVGLSMVELSMGKYPYPPETYSNVFAQLTAIVHGPPPELPEGYSEIACSFVDKCLIKEPPKRATYAELLEHPFLAEERTGSVDMVGWVKRAIAAREARREALRAAQSSNGTSAPQSSTES